jgi:hypothetical protein
MATTTWAPTFNDIAEEAFDLLQIGADGETLTASMQLRARKSYNYMMLSWQAQGMHLWTYTEGRLYMKKEQRTYDTSSASTADDFARITNNPIDDETAADASSGASTITVADGTKFTNGDNIGILLDDDTLQWTTINGAPAGDVITLTDVLTGDVASGRWVTAYNDTYSPISRIPNDGIRRYSGRQNNEVPALMTDRETYMSLSDKFTSSGTPVQIYFARQETVGTNGQGHEFFVWTKPDSAQWALNFTYERQINVIDTPTTDVVDFPRYWQEAIVWNLADRLRTKFGVKDAERAMEIKDTAAQLLTNVLNYDDSVVDVKVKVR